MVPGQIIVLDELPATANGKLDRAALPAFARSRSGAGAPPSAVQPLAPVRQQLLRDLFAEALGLEKVGLDDDFFELGGHSLQAVRLISRLSAALGQQLTVQVLFDSPTVALLAERLSLTDDGASQGVLFPIRPRGERPPLFFMPPVSGISWCYAGLAAEIDASYPLYGLQSPGGLAPGVPLRTIGELAALYLNKIKQVQPNGPYHLLGWSVGGLIAHEIAVQAQAGKQRVGLLALFDSFPFLGHDRDMDLPSDGSPAERRRALREYFGVGLEFSDQETNALFEVAMSNSLAAATFVPGVYDGDLVFVSAAPDSPGRRRQHATRAWRDHITGKIEHHDMNVDHFSMFDRANMAAIGRIIQTSIPAWRAG
jgi:thioesterase domain-containing protein/acyl carrier protein